MRRQNKTVALLTLGMLYSCILSPINADDACAITATDTGGMRFKNSQIDVKTSAIVGRDKGITEWRFITTNQDMIDRNRPLKTILGEGWDPIAFKGVPAGAPFAHRDFYAPIARGASPDGACVGIVQEAKKKYSLRRTIVMRRDYSVLKFSWKIENISGKAKGGAFRFFTACFPGALTGTSLKSTSVFMPTVKGVLELDQNLHSTVYKEKFGDTKFFTPRWDDGTEPTRWWTRRNLVTPRLNALWTCEVNRNNGNGIFFISDKKTLIGYYNDPQNTLEIVTEAFALQPGDKWSTSVLVGAFAVPKGAKVSSINPLFVTCGSDGIVPLFKGTLKVGNKQYPAAPNKLIKLDAAKLAELTALDTQNKVLGTVKNGVCSMSPEKIKYVVPKKPVFSGDIYNPDSAKIAEFLKKRDFTVYCGRENRDDVKVIAATIALKLGVGIAYTKPAGKLLAIGAANKDTLIRNIGLMNNSVSSDWPGTGKGALRFFQRLGITGASAITVAGSKTNGVLKALTRFTDQHMKDVKQPSGFKLSVVPENMKVFPYSRAFSTDGTKKIMIECAKGEYESAQLLLTAFSLLKNISINISDLINTKTGKKITNHYITSYRRRKGPIQVRWVGYFPYEPKDGVIHPDPLFERPVRTIPAGESRGVWLTFIIPEKAEAGLYKATLTCKSSSGVAKIPIEVKVWDFTIPRKGMMGEAYSHLQALPKWGKNLRDMHIDTYITNHVEHGMRFIHLTANNMLKWNFSPEGKFKDNGVITQRVSKDGKLMLDTSRFDHIKALCDKKGKPFKLIYMLYEGNSNFYWPAIRFIKTFPKRYKKRPGHPIINSRWEQEMITLFREYLEKRGWLKDVYLKISDEPGNVTKWYDELCQAAVKAKMPIFTAHGSSDLSTGTPEMSDIWQPIYGSYNDEFMKKARKARKLISMYNCGPPPTTAVGRPMSEWRSYLWQAAKLDLDIIAWWGIQCWTGNDGGQAIWRDRYSHWNSVIYPEHPENKPFYDKGNGGWKDVRMIDSIRWETIRDGMEDAWYINKLRTLIKSARANGRAKEADEAQNVLNGIWKSTYPDRLHYTPQFKRILENRRKIAHEILKLSKK